MTVCLTAALLPLLSVSLLAFKAPWTPGSICVPLLTMASPFGAFSSFFCLFLNFFSGLSLHVVFGFLLPGLFCFLVSSVSGLIGAGYPAVGLVTLWAFVFCLFSGSFGSFLGSFSSSGPALFLSLFPFPCWPCWPLFSSTFRCLFRNKLLRSFKKKEKRECPTFGFCPSG